MRNPFFEAPKSRGGLTRGERMKLQAAVALFGERDGGSHKDLDTDALKEAVPALKNEDVFNLIMRDLGLL